MRVTPLLRVMGTDAGSGTPSPRSSPSPSSEDDDGQTPGSSPVHNSSHRCKSKERFRPLVNKKFLNCILNKHWKTVVQMSSQLVNEHKV
jgi:hypothetical protein